MKGALEEEGLANTRNCSVTTFTIRRIAERKLTVTASIEGSPDTLLRAIFYTANSTHWFSSWIEPTDVPGKSIELSQTRHV